MSDQIETSAIPVEKIVADAVGGPSTAPALLATSPATNGTAAQLVGSASGASVQGEVYNPTAAPGQVAGFRFKTASGWNVMLRTRQEQAWLELTDGGGGIQHLWNANNYTTTGQVTAGTLQATANGVQFSGLANLPGSGTADLTIDKNGNVTPQTSSARFKEDIQPLDDDFARVLLLQPRSFAYRGTGERSIGYTAEEVDASRLSGLVSYDEEGKPLSVHYKLLPVYLLEVLKQQQAAIERLEDEVRALRPRAGSPALA